MTLFFELPDWAADLVADRYGNEKMIYAVPWDLGENDEFTDGYFVVTDRFFLFLNDGDVKREIIKDEYSDYKVTVMSGAGILEAKRGDCGEDVKLARFSMEHIARYATIAQKTNLARQGRNTDIREEPDKKCLKCGRPLVQGSSVCAYCAKKSAVLTRILGIAVKYVPYLAAAVAMMLAMSGINILMPYIYSRLVNDVYVRPAEERGNMHDFMMLFAFIILAYFTCRAMLALVSIFRSRLMARLSSNMMHDLRVMVFRHINSMSVSFTNDRKVGDLMSRVLNDTNRIKNFIQSDATECMNQLLTLIAIGTYLFFINWKMAFIVIIPAPLIVLIMRAFRRKTNKMYRRLWRLSGKCNSVLQDILNGIRVVKTFGTEKNETQRYRFVCKSYKDLSHTDTDSAEPPGSHAHRRNIHTSRRHGRGNSRTVHDICVHDIRPHKLHDITSEVDSRCRCRRRTCVRYT